MIESIRNGSNWMPEPPLPGHGDPYGPDDDQPTCGEEAVTKVCDNCGSHHHIDATCDRWECPRCWRRATLRGGIRAVSKLIHYRDKYSPDSDDLKFHRIVIVPPPEQDFRTVADPVDKIYDVGSDLLGYAGGSHGGIMTMHPYRHADEPSTDVDELDELDDSQLALIDSEDDQGVWKHTLPDWESDHTPDWAETRAKLSHEPHLHCYIISEHFYLDTKRIYEETGWFIRRLEPYENSNASCFGAEDLARSVMYALSHSAHFSNRDHFRYFGAVANESATEAQKRRSSRICRSHASHVLGLSEASITCKRDVSDDDETTAQRAVSGGSGSSGSTESTDSEEDPERTSCGGQLVHWRKIPELIESREWSDEIVAELEDLYEELAGEPPP
jgi:hypothetical protein